MGRNARGVVISHDDMTKLYRLRRNNNKQEMRNKKKKERHSASHSE
jgi:hypothetical protein